VGKPAVSDDTVLGNALRALLLLVAANGGPWLAARLLGARWGAPVDFGLTLSDGQRLLGAHKTWRGLMAGMLTTVLAACLTGLNWSVGAAVAALSLLGDLLSSACKRRLRRAPGSVVPLIDQLPESILPLAVLALPLGLNVRTVAAVVALFAGLNMASAIFRQRGSAV
jgi:CDP-2,3-bis-(O-geranylgeranyl)-sn-glycerol synthase